MQDFFTNCATVLQKYGFSYLRGAGTTLLLALVGTFFGCLIGFAVGALQTIPIDKQRDPAWKRVLLKILHIFLRCYVELFRGTPMIVQAVFIYYGLLQVFGIKMGMWQAGFFIVSINTGAYMAETVRGGIVSIDPGQTEGAKALGMNDWQTMLHRSATTSSSTSRTPRCCRSSRSPTCSLSTRAWSARCTPILRALPSSWSST